jgi:hypothetical protein
MNANDFAARVSNNIKQDGDPQFDILTIIMIVGLILNLIRVIQECTENKPEDVTRLTYSQKCSAIKNLRKNLPHGKKFLASRIFRGIMDEAKLAESEELKILLDTSA